MHLLGSTGRMKLVMVCLLSNTSLNNMSKGTQRNNIHIGGEVDIVQKHHQRSGELTRGFVEKILTKSANHPHGIKVKLETGEVGRVKAILED